MRARYGHTDGVAIWAARAKSSEPMIELRRRWLSTTTGTPYIGAKFLCYQHGAGSSKCAGRKGNDEPDSLFGNESEQKRHR